MKDGICPKCGSSQVYRRASGGHVTIWLNWIRNTNPMNYVCSSCGYVEWYIENRKHLDYIHDKWDKATKRKNDY
jgi:predicted nucleic-acid-binding Zn-ribbon protein